MIIQMMLKTITPIFIVFSLELLSIFPLNTMYLYCFHLKAHMMDQQANKGHFG
jgi:hypothetical protein